MNAGSSWGTSSGFGAHANPSGNFPSSGFTTGPSPANSNSTFHLFGAKSTGTNFGGQSASNTSSAFPASLTGSAAAPGTISSLSGSTIGTGSQSGGLFGNSTGVRASSNQTGGMFGSLNGGNNTPNGQLFGSNNSTGSAQLGGLFANSNTNSTQIGGASIPSKPSLSLFGASQQNPQHNETSANLFGKPSSQMTGGIFGSSNKTFGNLLSNSTGANNNQTSTLFGATNAPLGSFTGNSTVPKTGGLFGGLNTQNTTEITNSVSSGSPYGENLVLKKIARAEQDMPPSLTSFFFEKEHSALGDNNRVAPSSSIKSILKPSIVSRLARTFNIFRSPKNDPSVSNIAKLKGVFSQQNRVDDEPKITTSNTDPRKSAEKPSNFSIDTRNVGDYRKLVIKSTPSKFHLIDTDQVFKTRRKRTAALSPNSRHVNEHDCSDSNLDILRPSKIAKLNKKLGISTVGVSGNGDRLTNENQDQEVLYNGYFCSPTLEDLSVLSLFDLSKVDNFIVGRVGHGQISYSYPVDISNLFERCGHDITIIKRELFGRIIKFSNSTVRVYDDKLYMSPELGRELNVPATITLHAPPKACGIEDHIKRLKNMIGMEFVTYDPITFNWTFTVKHFSVWGLLDDSEAQGDESEELARLRSLKKKQDLKEQEASIVYSRLYQNDSYHNEIKRQRIASDTIGIPGGWDFDTSTRTGALSIKRNVVQNEINQEVNAFKERKFAHALAANASDITNDSDDESNKDIKEGHFPEELSFPREAGNYDYLKRIVNNAPLKAGFSDLVDEKAYEPEINDEAMLDGVDQHTSLATCKNWVLQLEIANNIVSAFATIPAPAGNHQLILNSVNDILFSDIDSSQSMDQRDSALHKNMSDKQLLLECEKTFSLASVPECFQGLLLQSDIQRRENGFPQVQFPGSASFASISKIFGDDPSFEFLKLASIIFDKPHSKSKCLSDLFADSNITKKLESIEKKKEFASWLRAYNIDSPVLSSSSGTDETFKAVCLGDIKSAVDLATKSQDLHLASLLTLLDSNDPTVKGIARSQIESWEEFGESNFIPKTSMKVCKLLAGKLGEFQCTLPNRILIGIHVLYGNPDESIEASFAKLPASVEVCPLSEMLSIYSAWQSGSVNQTGCEIEKSGLSGIVKWVLVQVLSCRESSEDLSIFKNTVGLSLGDELERAKLWKEAIHVYSTMSDESLLKEKIRKVVIDNVAEIIQDKPEHESFLIDVLKIPRTLLHEAYAIFNRRNKDMWECGEALVVAELWSDLHELICDELGPLAVIEEDSAMISRLKAIISCFPEKGGIIPGWNQGAGFFAKYFDIVGANENYSALEDSEIVFLLDNAASLKRTTSLKQAVSFKILAKKIGDLALEHYSGHADLSPKIMALCSGENERNYFKTRISFRRITIE
ncbi:hypothetical protein METBIDRAFT_35048 [Metschnikowia bicuspidata var. bicuspidata NRRL YB-4993]|uniref:Peptidase S59 domain-containing protein n=1 Tax=Metschnikowia bicuspidata var. bicuspidata NRRL YB-4993 TaxID=869754 RepID=A0A1A0HFE6_9ASCO|nr:hypothetical protein METBIDRAFT_35048 [Metschnikowia bicuspidata var. bicuspidata NRRL YB-4993]OBA22869.1 hypothetical protein METBIDRAFT_35048 [Metschnikowia bicuspidata var. bicuspidata NRRL YB-4993]